MRDFVRGTTREVATEALTGVSGPIYFQLLREDTFRGVVTAMTRDAPSIGADAPVHILAHSDATAPLYGRVRDYGLAMQVVDLEEADRLRVFESESSPDHVWFAGRDAAGLVTVYDADVYGLCGETETEPHLYERLARRVEESERVTPDLPGISTVRDALAERFDSSVAETFESSFAATQRRDSTYTDIGRLVLWVGARHELRFDELRRVITDTGLLSRASLQHRLDELTDTGLVNVTPVPDPSRGVNRRLTVGLDGIDDELPSVVVRLLSE